MMKLKRQKLFSSHGMVLYRQKEFAGFNLASLGKTFRSIAPKRSTINTLMEKNAAYKGLNFNQAKNLYKQRQGLAGAARKVHTEMVGGAKNLGTIQQVGKGIPQFSINSSGGFKIGNQLALSDNLKTAAASLNPNAKTPGFFGSLFGGGKIKQSNTSSLLTRGLDSKAMVYNNQVKDMMTGLNSGTISKTSNNIFDYLKKPQTPQVTSLGIDPKQFKTPGKTITPAKPFEIIKDTNNPGFNISTNPARPKGNVGSILDLNPTFKTDNSKLNLGKTDLTKANRGFETQKTVVRENNSLLSQERNQLQKQHQAGQKYYEDVFKEQGENPTIFRRKDVMNQVVKPSTVNTPTSIKEPKLNITGVNNTQTNINQYAPGKGKTIEFKPKESQPATIKPEEMDIIDIPSPSQGKSKVGGNSNNGSSTSSQGNVNQSQPETPKQGSGNGGNNESSTPAATQPETPGGKEGNGTTTETGKTKNTKEEEKLKLGPWGKAALIGGGVLGAGYLAKKAIDDSDKS